MSRPLRIEYEGACYHVTSRGNEKKDIFYSNADREKILEYIQSACRKFDAIIYAFCLMTNHYHLLIKTLKANLSRILHYINMSYTNYFNHKMERSGHLFQGRYKSIVVEEDPYLLTLSRYIHLNPVRADIVENPIEYPWSSYKYFVTDEKVPEFLDITGVLNYFNNNKAKYREYVEEGLMSKMEDPLAGVVADMMLGGQGFVERITDKYVRGLDEDREIPAIGQLKRGKISADKIIQVIDDEDGLTGKDKDKEKYKAYFLKEYTDLSLTEISKRIHNGELSKSAVSLMVSRFRSRVERDENAQRTIEELYSKM